MTQPTRRQFLVSEPCPGRLDKWLTNQLVGTQPGLSREIIKRWISEGRVTIDGVPGRAASTLHPGVEVIVTIGQAQSLSDATPDPSISLDVVYEDDHLLVLNKPGGLVVHPGRGHATGTLVHALLARPGFDATQFASDGTDTELHLRPGIVHRLDKGTSGLMVVAKDNVTREGLKERFATHDIEREYVAIVVGAGKTTTFDTLHGRHPTDRIRFSTRVREGRRAVTHVAVVESLPDATLMRCTLDTGRTHQIRVHLAEVGLTPVLGDPVYGKKPKVEMLASAAERLGRQALHARVLGFEHPISKEPLRWVAEPPSDFAEVLDALRRHGAALPDL